jgi:hypothetical protein
MRDAVKPLPTRSARVAAALQRLDGDVDAAVIEHHAGLILAAMLDLIAAYRARGFEIGRDDGGFYARPKKKTKGLARELPALAAKCRKAVAGKISREDWTSIWAAQPERIKALWKPTLIETADGRTIDSNELALGFTAGEGKEAHFGMVAPKPDAVLPAIESELARITATPSSKTRKANDSEAKAIDASAPRIGRSPARRAGASSTTTNLLAGFTTFAARLAASSGPRCST